MKLKFLGTAAAEAIPALWCECEVCRKAKIRGGKEIRRRCSYLLDDDTLIDFGPDAYWQSIEFGIDLPSIDRIVFTHSHEDHLNPVDLFWRNSPGFSRVTKPLTVIGSRRIFGTIMVYAGAVGVSDFATLHLRPVPALPGERMRDGDLELLPLRANHDPHSDPLIYVFTRGGKSVSWRTTPGGSGGVVETSGRGETRCRRDRMHLRSRGRSGVTGTWVRRRASHSGQGLWKLVPLPGCAGGGESFFAQRRREPR